MSEEKLESGWLAKDVEEATQRVKQWNKRTPPTEAELAVIYFKEIKTLLNNLIIDNKNNKFTGDFMPYYYRTYPGSFEYQKNVTKPAAEYISERIDQYIEVFKDDR